MKTNIKLIGGALGLAILLSAGAVLAYDHDKPAAEKGHSEDHSMAGMHHEDGAKATSPSKAGQSNPSTAYPLSTCLISGEAIGADGAPVFYDYNGREIRFCCEDCIAKFEAEPDKYIAKLDAAIIKQQQADYPLDTCMVTGESINGMGGPVDIVVDNRLVRLCCGGCEEEIRSHPDKYIGMLDQAVKDKQRASYPATTCPITGEKLGGMGEVVEIVYAGKLVRFCCPDCQSKFMEDPNAGLAKIYGKS